MLEQSCLAVSHIHHLCCAKYVKLFAFASHFFVSLIFQMRVLVFIALVLKLGLCQNYCGSGNRINLQYVTGDAMTESYDCLGPDGRPYPM